MVPRQGRHRARDAGAAGLPAERGGLCPLPAAAGQARLVREQRDLVLLRWGKGATPGAYLFALLTEHLRDPVTPHLLGEETGRSPERTKCWD